MEREPYADNHATTRREVLNPAIEQMHSAGVWHNDLHARNVVRGRDGCLRIVDFGYATFENREGDTWLDD